MTIAEILKAKGLDDATINAIQEDMKANKIFTASEENLDIRYGKLKTEHETVVKERDEGKTLIETLQKSNKGNENLQKQISEYEANMAQLQTELEQTKLEAAIKVELLSAKALDVDYLTFKLREKGELELDDQGKIKGMDDKIAALKTQFPTQFEGAGAKIIEERKLPEGDTGGRATVTKDEFNKMGYNARVALKQNDPEAYSQMMKG